MSIAGTDTDRAIFDELATNLEPELACEMRNCEQGNPRATHLKILVLPCHRGDALQCTHCAERQQRAINSREPGTGTKCKRCGTSYAESWHAFVEVRPL